MTNAIKRNLTLCVIFIFIVITFLMYLQNESYTKHSNSSIIDNDSVYICLRNNEINNLDLGIQFPMINFEKDLSLSDLLNKSSTPILVFRFKETNCRLCIDNELEMMNKCLSNFDKHCIILGSFGKNVKLKNFMRIKKIETLSFEVPYDCLKNWNVEQYEAPYYFILHPNLRVSNFFIPEKAFPSLTEQYLKGVKRLISKSE